MVAFRHFSIVLAYGLFAVAVALVLPGFVPAMGQPSAVVAGAVVFLFGAVIHEVVARRDRDAVFSRQIYALRSVVGRLSDEAALLRDESRTLRQGVADAAEGVEQRTEEHLEKVVSEVRVLQGLIGRLSTTSVADREVAARELAARELADRGHRVPVAASVAGAGLGSRPGFGPGSGPASSASSSTAASASMLGATTVTGPKSARPDQPRAGVRTDLGHGEILDIVRDGLKRDRVDLFLQPIVSLPQRKPRFYEGFSRIRDEDGAMILPEQYIDVARQEGFLGAIDNMLLFRCVQLVRKAQRHKHNLGFFCNISVHTLTDRAFFREFIAFMAANRELASQLTFEFVQEDIASRWDDVSQDLYSLARLGFYFSMDRVQRLDLDAEELARRHFKFVKVDAPTLLEAGQSHIDVGGLKRDLDRNGIDMIGSKIETEAELVELLDYKIDFGQGYLFGEPRLSRDG